VNLPWLALIAVVCNVGAQLAIKSAGERVTATGGITAWLDPILALAVALYGLSFLLTVKVFAVNPLTIAAPIMAGGSFALVALAGSWLLGETPGLVRLGGMAMIVLGIVLIVRSS